MLSGPPPTLGRCNACARSARRSATPAATAGGGARRPSRSRGWSRAAPGTSRPSQGKRSAPCSSRSSTPENLKPPDARSDVPDVLAPGLTALFCGINPGRFSAAANAHFANPRNDFWRLLHEAGFTPRRFDPSEQFELLPLRIGVTNAAYRTTPGSGDLRSGDFAGSAERLGRIAADLAPRAIAFVGKEAYRGVFRERPALGLQERRLHDTLLFVLPSTSPANAAVPYAERLHWFRALREVLA